MDQDQNLKELGQLCENGQQVGDVELFFFDWLEPDETEITIMIGEKSARRKGLAFETLQIVMDFAIKYFKKTKFLVKIQKTNNASMNLFEKLGYKFIKNQDVFNEKLYVWDIKENIPINVQYDIEEIKQEGEL